MGNSEETKDCKPEKSSSPPPEQQQTSHVYPDWAAMQAYYGPRMPVPPYFNSAVASGHAPPPYLWGPLQHMMPPYAAIYPHGGVYAHPGAPLAASPMNIDSPAKSSANSDRGLMKKLKGFDGLAMSIGNDNGGSAGGGKENGVSQSEETEGSSEGSDGNTTEGGQNGGKRSRQGSPSISEVGKTNGASKKGAIIPANPATELELKISTAAANMTSSPATMIPDYALFQNDRELKRERRKQSNRESARRSRLRKQAEAEELAIKVDSLNAENLTLKSEINRLTLNSEKLKLQNTELMEKLKTSRMEHAKDEPIPNSTANLLSRVDNNSGSDGDGKPYENRHHPEPSSKLHQLLDDSTRANAVAAG